MCAALVLGAVATGALGEENTSTERTIAESLAQTVEEHQRKNEGESGTSSQTTLLPQIG